jgi:hypothetical protein
VSDVIGWEYSRVSPSALKNQPVSLLTSITTKPSRQLTTLYYYSSSKASTIVPTSPFKAVAMFCPALKIFEATTLMLLFFSP